MIKQALRDNKGKLTWSNFPLFLIRPMIKVADFGGRKYAKFNYLKGAPISQYLDCIKRHLDAFEDPEQSDIDESGENHLAHISWNALVAIYMLTHHPELDDRWKPDKKTESEGAENVCVSGNPVVVSQRCYDSLTGIKVEESSQT